MDLPQQVKWILQQLQTKGFAGYAVGGCVRDTLLGRTPNDWDVCTNALPQQVEQCFKGCKVLQTGIIHGTVTLILEHRPYEITTYRVDGEYADHRRPDQVRFVAELQQDLARRDFTINAMACGLDGQVKDFFAGQRDLDLRRICCVGQPEQRFEEDALRILRALRFAAVLDFELEPATVKAAREKKQLLAHVSAERVFAELNKLICGPAAGRILRQCGDILAQVIPEIGPCIDFDQQNPCHDRDVWTHTADALQAAPPDPILRWALLLHDLAKPACFSVDSRGIGHSFGHPVQGEQMAHRIFRRLKAEKKLEKQVCQLIGWHDAELQAGSSSARRWLNRLGTEQLLRLLEMKRCDIDAHAMVPRMEMRRLELEEFTQQVQKLLTQKVCVQIGDLAVNGNDLLLLGIPAGPEVGKLLTQLLEQVLSEKLPNEKQVLLEWAMRQIK